MSTRPAASSPQVRERMRVQRRRDTAAELAIRREVHRRGLRYRVDRQVVPGVRRRADLVFGPARVAVFVDGCFWHCCPRHATSPKANAGWWAEKLAANVARDRDTDARLAAAGWVVVRCWEHEDPVAAAERIAHIVSQRRPCKGSVNVDRAGTPNAHRPETDPEPEVPVN